MIADFATTLVDPPRVRCLGVEMLPFSLGHLLTLRAMGNRFVTGEFPIYDDLISAAFVCAHTFEENQKLMRQPRRRWLRLKVWGAFAGKFQLVTQLLVMRRHIEEACAMPETRKVKGEVRYLYSEWETRLYAHLLALGHAPSAALNMPLLLANKLFIAHLEETNAVAFKSVVELAREKAMNDIVERMERGEIAA
jgi:hypothetical protein